MTTFFKTLAIKWKLVKAKTTWCDGCRCWIVAPNKQWLSVHYWNCVAMFELEGRRVSDTPFVQRVRLPEDDNEQEHEEKQPRKGRMGARRKGKTGSFLDAGRDPGRD